MMNPQDLYAKIVLLSGRVLGDDRAQRALRLIHDELRRLWALEQAVREVRLAKEGLDRIELRKED